MENEDLNMSETKISVPTEKTELNHTTKKHLNKTFIILILLAVSFFLIGFFIGRTTVNTNQEKMVKDQEQTIKDQQTTGPSFLERLPGYYIFEIENNTIYTGVPELGSQKLSDDKFALFVNANGVSSVRQGFEGKTLHFKIDNQENTSARCVEFEKLSDGSANNLEPPWNFSRNGLYDGIKSCGNMKSAGGYLKTANYFVYLETGGDLVLWNLQNMHRNDISTQTNSNLAVILKGLVNGTYFAPYIENSDRGAFYPQKDYIFQSNLFLAFGRFLMIVNLDRMQIEDYYSLAPPEFADPPITEAVEFNPTDISNTITVDEHFEGPPRSLVNIVCDSACHFVDL